MRFMVIVKASKDSEAGIMPSTEMLEAMGKYNEELVKAGVLLALDGLLPPSAGVRVSSCTRSSSRASSRELMTTPMRTLTRTKEASRT